MNWSIMDFVEAMRRLGIQKGSVILVHSAFKPLRPRMKSPETVIEALLETVGESGTLLMPALSYLQNPPTRHFTATTPANVGVIAETFRQRPDVRRSIHPTHSICGIGPDADVLLKEHQFDYTPCGPHSPLNKMINRCAAIVMLGCGLRPNTTMHALEEYVVPPYLFGGRRLYTITDERNVTYRREYIKHGFKGWVQRYDRVVHLPGSEGFIRHGMVVGAEVYVISSQWLKKAVLAKLHEDPLFFVDRISTGQG